MSELTLPPNAGACEGCGLLQPIVVFALTPNSDDADAKFQELVKAGGLDAVLVIHCPGCGAETHKQKTLDPARFVRPENAT